MNDYSEESSGMSVLTLRGQVWGDGGGTDRILTTRVGLRFPGQLPFVAWETAGQRVFRLHDSSAWCLGDWLIYGRENYSDRYKHAIEVAGLDYQTLRNYAWVAGKFELGRRRENLSFQHHAEVVSLPIEDQESWLDRVESGKWTRNQLRHQLRQCRERTGLSSGKRKPLPQVYVSSEQMTRWNEAAGRLEYSLDEWMVDVLDRAATEVLHSDGKPAR
jgi:hypothetical protein